MTNITAENLYEAIQLSNEDRHPSNEAYLSGEDLSDVTIDGRINLVLVCKILNDQESSSRT